MTATAAKAVAVVGAGMMGHGIAQAFARAGAEVTVFDPDDGALGSLHERIEGNLASLGEEDAIAARVHASGSIAELLAGAEMVIEAAPEDLMLKQKIFAELDSHSDPEAVLATNTSVISIGEIASGAAGRPGRVLGTHWWNPPYLVPLVEVIEAETTEAETVARTIAYLHAAGKTPVHVRCDTPGFVGNRLQHALWREALALVDSGVCDPDTVDLVIREGFGRRLAAIGPIENADLIGLDLTEAIHGYLLPHLDRGTEPAAGLRERVARGELGAKSGQGYLEWDADRSRRVQERLTAALLHPTAGSRPGGDR